MTISITIFSIMTLGIRTLCIIGLSETLSIMTFSIMTPSIMTLRITVSNA
jgi:hypothetical protein